MVARSREGPVNGQNAVATAINHPAIASLDLNYREQSSTQRRTDNTYPRTNGYHGSYARENRGGRHQDIIRLRENVRLTRSKLHNQREDYVQQREYFKTTAHALIKALNTVMNQNCFVPNNEKVRKKYNKVRTTAALLSEVEQQTTNLENELSSLEYWLDQREGILYSSDVSAGVYVYSSEDDDHYDNNSATSSTTATTQAGNSLLKRYHHQFEEVGFLQERLEELDFDHQSGLGHRQWRQEQGIRLLESDAQYVEEYEQSRQDIMTQIVSAERELYRLKVECDREGVHLEEERFVESPMSRSSRMATSKKQLIDGVLRRFPGTYNGDVGWGLPLNRITTGYTPPKERLDSWLDDLLYVRSDFVVRTIIDKPILSTVSRPDTANSLTVGESNNVGHANIWSTASTGGQTSSHHELSVWNGDAPKRRHSVPILKEEWETSAGYLKCL